MSEAQARQCSAAKELLVCMDFPAALLCITPAPASGSSNSISQKDLPFTVGKLKVMKMPAVHNGKEYYYYCYYYYSCYYYYYHYHNHFIY